MKTKIDANIGIEIEFPKFNDPYFSNIHLFRSFICFFALDSVSLEVNSAPTPATGKSVSLEVNSAPSSATGRKR